MTGESTDRIQDTHGGVAASPVKDTTVSPMSSWLDQTFAAAEEHEKTVSFEHPNKSETKWINGVEKALSGDYASAFAIIDFAAVGDALAKRQPK